MNLPSHIGLTTFIIKRAAGEPTQAPIDSRILAAILGGGAGALGGGAIQGIRKLMQSKEDERREGSPSILKGMLLGGLGGAGLGAGLEHWNQSGAPAPMSAGAQEAAVGKPVLDTSAPARHIDASDSPLLAPNRNAVVEAAMPKKLTRSGAKVPLASTPFNTLIGTGLTPSSSDPILALLRGQQAGTVAPGLQPDSLWTRMMSKLPDVDNPITSWQDMKAQEAAAAKMLEAQRQSRPSIFAP